MRSSRGASRRSEARRAIGGRLSPGGLLAPEPGAYANGRWAESRRGRTRRDPRAAPRRGSARLPARLTVVEWTHRSRSAAAFDRFMAERHGGRLGSASAPVGRLGETRVRHPTRRAARRPSHSRARRGTARSRQVRRPAKRYQVRDGERWVVWDADWGAVTDETEQEGGPPSTSYAFLLDPVGARRRLPARRRRRGRGRRARRTSPARGPAPRLGGRDSGRVQRRGGRRRARPRHRRGARSAAASGGATPTASPSTGWR